MTDTDLNIEKLVKARTVLAIMGPTASGKTALALRLAKSWPIEIISVDSALIYKGMDIGTAKPSQAEREQVPHHLIDLIDPAQSYSAADFVVDAKRLVEEVLQRGRLPVLVGGTMMYFHALQQGMADLPSADPAIRAQLQQEYDQDPQVLHQRLQACDPKAAQRIHYNDPQRLIRALEVYQITGEALTDLQKRQSNVGWDVNLLKVGLIPQSRERLHQKIQRRLEIMVAQGFLDEARNLFARPDLHADLPSIRSVGYRQAWCYLNGEYDQTVFEQKALIATRQLAKRQLTWLRKEQDLLSLDPFELSVEQQAELVRVYLQKNTNL
ncbi:MAG: tRNA (adenosine(37)-N6)-dimethylallyltransferase MiaA [Thiomicrospira sp.]|uniref:tRNA (adenosine(37)-N6)-dimethylallyltransferase MiaA n=1 Tax=Thiomicrospira sp. TaxID=935 RepID=UPI0019F78BCD|nr:tRNA (adenosine(37)-N6)-dimethylallyltransferase MiaA [Thiomicrospira sp.]MBE0494282.1 tRNA (adenosine(37)-N6)-dimethylallyltransferase MiaA [Thiomicrospira sp.]